MKGQKVISKYLQKGGGILMLKKMMSVIMVLLLLSCFFITVLAGSVTPRYMYTSSILSDLTISGSTATCISEVKGHLGETTKIRIEQVLEKETSPGNWEEVDSWINVVNNYRSSLTNAKSGLSNGTYRVKTVARVYVVENFEQNTVYSVVKICN